MTKTLTLFPDTNLFVQCKPLNQLNWTIFDGVDEIKLIITRPVQAEIDSQKARGSGRLSKRARSASTLFRELLQPDMEYKVISSKPRVLLFLRQDLKGDRNLAEQLDYAERDDQLVGIAAGYAALYPDEEVRVLTHDTGPMASAKLVGIPFEEVPEEWLLAPETDESEKRINKLEGDLLRYQKAEPAFSLDLAGEVKGDTATLKFEIIRYTSLTNAEIESLMGEIKRRFPVSDDFGPRNAHLGPIFHGGMVFVGAANEIFIPATEQEIENYKNTLFPNWLANCENSLRHLHEKLKTAWPTFTVHVYNHGSRPAVDALISIRANGQFLIAPPAKQKDGEEVVSPRLPNAPKPPTGSWSKRLAIGDAVKVPFMDQALDRFTGAQHFSSYSTPFRPDGRDPNAFYYKPSRPERPGSSFALECEQWRHQTTPEGFDVVLFTGIPGVVKGAIEVEVNASNMSMPFVSHVSVQILVKNESALEVATELIDKLKVGTRFQLGIPSA
jgi:hypothetical protein